MRAIIHKHFWRYKYPSWIYGYETIITWYEHREDG